MQNHIPNDPQEYAEEYKVNAELPGMPQYYVNSLESVATGLRDADRAIGLLCDYFAGCDRDVVILFFRRSPDCHRRPERPGAAGRARVLSGAQRGGAAQGQAQRPLSDVGQL